MSLGSVLKFLGETGLEGGKAFYRGAAPKVVRHAPGSLEAAVKAAGLGTPIRSGVAQTIGGLATSRTFVGAAAGGAYGFATSDANITENKVADTLRGAVFGGVGVGLASKAAGAMARDFSGRRLLTQSMARKEILANPAKAAGLQREVLEDISNNMGIGSGQVAQQMRNHPGFRKEVAGAVESRAAGPAAELVAAEGIHKTKTFSMLGGAASSTARTGIGAARAGGGMLGFAARNKGKIALGVGGIAGAHEIDHYRNYQDFSSPTLEGASVQTEYGVQAFQMSGMRTGTGGGGTGFIGTAPEMSSRNASLQRSTAGLVQGLHRGRHG